MADVSFPNYGLLGGLAEGLKQGLISYQNTKNIERNNQMQNMLMGMQKNPETGALEYTPEKAAQVKAQGLTAQRSIDELDPNSAISQRLGGVRGQLLHNANPKAGADLFSGMSAADQKEIDPLVKSDVSGQYGLLKQLYNPLTQVKAGQLEETKNQNSIAAGNKFNQNPIILAADKNLGSLKRSQSILDNPNKPVTSRDLNLAYTDYINAVAAGGAATEGKITRELPETWATDWNTLKQKAGVNDDLRNDPTGAALIGMLRENIGTVHHDLREAAANEAKSLHKNYSQTSNQKVKAVADDKLKEYTDAQDDSPQGLMLGARAQQTQAHPQDAAAVQWAKANPNDPRSAAILKANGL